MSRLISSLTHVRSLMSAASVNTARRLEPNPPDLIEWVRKEGGFVHQAVKVAVVEPYGLGLVASEEIPNGSDLIALPEHVPLKFGSVEPEGKDGTFSVLVDLARQVPEEMWAMKLGLKLLQERAKKGSFWWPYISNLPETYSLPIFSAYDTYEWQYYPLLKQINKRGQFLCEFGIEVHRKLQNLKSDDHPFGGQDVNFNSLKWGMSAVSSRAFPLYGSKRLDDTYVDAPMMLPLIDMCNHSFDPNAEIVQEQETDSTNMLVKVVSKKQIKQEEALVLNYGCLNNDLFLLDYGFVIPSNPYDYIELKYDAAHLDAAIMKANVASPKSHSLSSPAPWQQQILCQLNLVEGSTFKAFGGPQIVDGRLLAAVRVLLATDMEAVQKHNIDTLKLLSVEAPLGKENEEAALRTIIALASIAGCFWPTLLNDDMLLKQQDVSASLELAMRYRIQKKSILNDVMRDLTTKVNLLLGPKPEKKKRKAKVPITG